MWDKWVVIAGVLTTGDCYTERQKHRLLHSRSEKTLTENAFENYLNKVAEE